MSNSEYIRPATNDKEAERRYKKFKGIDPFPEIQPALLNSADFIDYAVTTGMIFPFDQNVGIKPASYEVKLGSEVLYWDDKNKRKYSTDITGNKTIKFRKNSITFVTVAAHFRIPDYIALRFNLQIHHVHRGLLLGTGPLVDPGFNGKLMIPIHNLTENDYEVDENEGLICIEFTKLSDNDIWKGSTTEYEKLGSYKPNPGKKNKKTFLDYIKMHVPHGKVRSSLLSTLADMTVKMDDANDAVRQIKSTVQRYLSWGSLAIAVAMISLVISVYGLTSDANKYVADAKNIYIEKLNESPDGVLLDINRREFSIIRDNLKSFKMLLDSNMKELPAIRAELKDLKEQLDAANMKILNNERSFQLLEHGD